MFVSSHTDSALSTTVFDNVTVTQGDPIPNSPPTAENASFASLRDTPVATTLTATDPNSDPLTYSVVTPPAHGTLSGTAPNLTYTPSAGYLGADSFTFKASDGQVDSNTATVSLTVTAPGGPVPAPWATTDVGSPALAGSSTYDDLSGTFSVTGAGADVFTTNDQFRYVHRPLTGDGEVVARVTSQTNSHPSAKAGVMIKESTTAFSPYAMVGITPANGIKFQWSFNPESSSGGTYTLPDAWLKLKRVGNVLTAYTSADGITWTQVGSPKTVAMGSAVTAGLFVTSHKANALSTATFDHVAVTPTSPPPNTPPVASGASFSTLTNTPVATPLAATDANSDPLTYSVVTPPAHGTLSGTAPSLTYTPAAGYAGPDAFTFKANDGQADSNTATVSLTVTPPGGPVPAPWLEADVGVVTPDPGSALYDSGTQTFTVDGGGYDIWGTHDDFHYVHQPLDGDGQITARVTSQTVTHDSAKAGVMIKESTTPFTPYSFLGITPTKGYKFQWNFLNQSVSGGAFTLPDGWVRLTRVGDVITASRSADGVTWTQVTQKTVPMGSSATIGLFVTSHDAGEMGTATFDHVSVTT
jgi:regulation of enolase protein 1 (concanavalin A-like superfamily)